MLFRCAFFASPAELAEAGSWEEADPVSKALPLKDQPFSTTPPKLTNTKFSGRPRSGSAALGHCNNPADDRELVLISACQAFVGTAMASGWGKLGRASSSMFQTKECSTASYATPRLSRLLS